MSPDSQVTESAEHEAEKPLIDGIRKGDAGAFEAVVRAYGPRLTRFAFGFVHGKEEAEDVVQDVLWRVWEGRRDWAPRVSLRAYLFTAVRNRALNALAHQRVQTQYTAAQQHAALFDPDAAATPESADANLKLDEERVAIARVRGAFARLTERQQTAVRLRYEQGLPMSEVASALEVSVSGAEQLIARAIRAMRAEAVNPD